MSREARPHTLITGSRVITLQRSLELLRPVFEESSANTVFLFGDAEGPDTAARMLARLMRFAYIEIGPPWAFDGNRGGLERNGWLVDLLPHTHSRVVAVWDGRSGGTADAMRKARERGFDVEVLRG